MTSRPAIPLCVFLVLLAAGLACSGGGLVAPPATVAPTQVSAEALLFEDDFSTRRGGWATGRDEIGNANLVEGEYMIEIYEPSYIVWGSPNLGTVSDVRVVVTARNVGAAQDASFGVMCHLDGDNYYYFAIGSDGYYAIVLNEGTTEVFLSNTDGWQQSPQIRRDQDAYTLEVTCAADGTLELVVDGKLISSVNDRTYKTGEVALFAYSFDETPVEVRFDDLAVIDLSPPN